MQSRKMSAVEAGINVFIGFLLGVTVNYFLLPVIGDGIDAAVMLTMSFTAMSYIRQYILRRWFNC